MSNTIQNPYPRAPLIFDDNPLLRIRQRNPDPSLPPIQIPHDTHNPREKLFNIFFGPVSDSPNQRTVCSMFQNLFGSDISEQDNVFLNNLADAVWNLSAVSSLDGFQINPALADDGNREHILDVISEVVKKGKFLQQCHSSPSLSPEMSEDLMASFAAAVLHDMAKLQPHFIELDVSTQQKQDTWDPLTILVRREVYPTTDGKIAFSSATKLNEIVLTHQYSKAVKNIISLYFSDNPSLCEKIQRAVIDHGQRGSSFVANTIKGENPFFKSPLFQDTTLFEHIMFAAKLPGVSEVKLWYQMQNAVIQSIETGAKLGKRDAIFQRFADVLLRDPSFLSELGISTNQLFNCLRSENKKIERFLIQKGIGDLPTLSEVLFSDLDNPEYLYIAGLIIQSIIESLSPLQFKYLTRFITVEKLQLPDNDNTTTLNTSDTIMAMSDSQANGVLSQSLVNKYLGIWGSYNTPPKIEEIFDPQALHSKNSLVGLMYSDMITIAEDMKRAGITDLYLTPKTKKVLLETLGIETSADNIEKFFSAFRDFINDTVEGKKLGITIVNATNTNQEATPQRDIYAHALVQSFVELQKMKEFTVRCTKALTVDRLSLPLELNVRQQLNPILKQVLALPIIDYFK